MKKTGIIIIGIVILGAILFLTLVLKVFEFFVGAIFFVVAAIIFIYVLNKIKDKIT